MKLVLLNYLQRSTESIFRRILKSDFENYTDRKCSSYYSFAEVPKNVTIKARFRAEGREALDIARTAILFNSATKLTFNFVRKQGFQKCKGSRGIREGIASIAYKFIDNRKYAVGVGLVIEEILKSAERLGDSSQRDRNRRLVDVPERWEQIQGRLWKLEISDSSRRMRSKCF